MHTIGDSFCRDVHDAQQGQNSDEELELFEENGSSDSYFRCSRGFEKASCARELQTTDCSSKRTAHLEENVMLVSHGSIMVDLEWCT